MDDIKTGKTRTRTRTLPVRKRRRFWKFLAALTLLAVALIVALPWLLGTRPARSWLVGKINARVAPGSVELLGSRLSWFGPIELSGVGVRDPKGKLVLGAGKVVLDRGILGLMTDRANFGTITIEEATIDVERRADGSIDVLEALASAFPADPAPAKPTPGVPPAPAPGVAPAPVVSKTIVSVVLKEGTLRIVSPELVEPIVANSIEGSVTIAPGKPMEMLATLTNEGQSIKLHATIDQGHSADPEGDRTLTVVSKGWPIHVRQGGVDARGRLEGALEVRQEIGLWVFKGDAALLNVEATGPSLLGDRLKVDRLAVSGDLGESSTGWMIRKFELTSPFASLSAQGSIPAFDGKPAELRGRVDLALLAKMLPHAMRLRDGLTIDQGAAIVRADLTTHDGSEHIEVTASLDDFVAIEGGRRVVLREAARLNAVASRSQGKITVESSQIKAAGVDIKGSGDLESGVKLAGTIDLVALNAQIRDVLDLGAFHVSGHARVAADYRRIDAKSYKARFAADCKDLKLAGLTAEPIVHDLVQFNASTVGASQPDGSPIDWREARVDFKAGDVKLDLLATSKDGDVALIAGAGMAVASPVPGRAEARASFRRKGQVFEIDELKAGLTPDDPKAAPGAVALALRGKLDLTSGEGTFASIPGATASAIGLGTDGARLSGLGRSDVPLKVEAGLLGDLAALDRLLASWSGSPLKGLAGSWSGQVSVARSVEGTLDVDGTLDAPEIVAPSLNGPVSVGIKAEYFPVSDRLELANLALSTTYGKVAIVGKLIETKSRKLMDMTATFEPNWTTIDKLVATSVEPNARFRANFRPIKLGGSLLADSTPNLLGQMQGEVGLDLTMGQAFGVKLGPTPVVLKLGAGRAVFDPIVTTMNDGPVLIQSDLGFDNDYGLWFRLNPSRIEKAGINEAVSNSILAYVAPVLAKSSSVTGKVTVAINKAAIPVTAKGSMFLDGAMAFQDVYFKPGPLANELTSVTGRASPTLRLDQTMIVMVANGRVQQTGLSIPIGGDGFRVAIEGSVGFDDSLDLKATVPLSAKMLGLDASLDKAIGTTTVAVPIRGTLARPAVDRKALSVAVRDVAKKLGESELKGEAGRFLNRIAGPNQTGGEPRSKPAGRNPLGDLENLGREILDGKKP